MEKGVGFKLPPRFIQDCLECDCDVGEYQGGSLCATDAQLSELISRAQFYADAHGPDAAPAGLKTAAKALLRSLEKLGKVGPRQPATRWVSK